MAHVNYNVHSPALTGDGLSLHWDTQPLKLPRCPPNLSKPKATFEHSRIRRRHLITLETTCLVPHLSQTRTNSCLVQHLTQSRAASGLEQHFPQTRT